MEAFTLRLAAQQARRIVDHHKQSGSLDFLRHWRGCAIWLEKRAAAIERGEDPDHRDDPNGELFGPETAILVPEENDWMLDRVLIARDADGKVAARWRYSGNGWTCIEGRERGSGVGIRDWADLFSEIVAGCITHGWQLVSSVPVGVESTAT